MGGSFKTRKPTFKKGDRVRVEVGNFADEHGEVLSAGKASVEVLLDLDALCEEDAIHIAPEYLKKVKK